MLMKTIKKYLVYFLLLNLSISSFWETFATTNSIDDSSSKTTTSTTTKKDTKESTSTKKTTTSSNSNNSTNSWWWKTLKQIREERESLKTTNLQEKAVKDIILELKLEDLNENDPNNLRVKAIWKDEKGKTISIKYFSTDWYLLTFSKKIPRESLYWTVELLPVSSTSVNDYVLDKPYTIELNYNKFDGTTTERRQLIYVQVKDIEDQNKYEIVWSYTQEDKDKLVTEKADTPLYYKWRVSLNEWEMPIWIYNNEGVKLYETKTDYDWSFSILIDKSKIEYNKDYNVIWWKDGDLSKWISWILWEGKKYNFKNLRDLLDQFGGETNLQIKRNEKDIVKEEPFPYVYAIILVLLYLWIIYVFWIKLIKKLQRHPLKNKKHIFFYKGRKEKIMELREKFNLDNQNNL